MPISSPEALKAVEDRLRKAAPGEAVTKKTWFGHGFRSRIQTRFHGLVCDGQVMGLLTVSGKTFKFESSYPYTTRQDKVLAAEAFMILYWIDDYTPGTPVKGPTV